MINGRLTGLALLLCTLVSCATGVVRGSFTGPRYVNEVRRYSFALPANWIVASDSPAAQSAEFAVRPADDRGAIVLGFSAPGRAFGDLGHPRTLVGPDRDRMLRRLFPGTPGDELESFTTRVVEHGSGNRFLVASRPRICTLDERLQAAKRHLSSIDHAAAIEKNGVSYVLYANLCSPDADEGFATILESMTFW